MGEDDKEDSVLRATKSMKKCESEKKGKTERRTTPEKAPERKGIRPGWN